jgi:hypothetical protein
VQPRHELVAANDHLLAISARWLATSPAHGRRIAGIAVEILNRYQRRAEPEKFRPAIPED